MTAHQTSARMVGARPPARVAQVEGPPSLDTPRRRRFAVGQRAAPAVKRLVDVVGAGSALLVLAPPMALIALAVRAESRGPAFFGQRRIGRGGRPFVMWKFRTMVHDAERRRDALVALSRDPDWLHLDADPRITRVGRMLRRASLDELPQLVNVLRGEMSLVGPRPLIPSEHDRMPSWAQVRDAVRPGMTGLWQVNGRTTTTYQEMLRLDCEYVQGLSLRSDARILVRTLPAVLSGTGAN